MQFRDYATINAWKVGAFVCKEAQMMHFCTSSHLLIVYAALSLQHPIHLAFTCIPSTVSFPPKTTSDQSCASSGFPACVGHYCCFDYVHLSTVREGTTSVQGLLQPPFCLKAEVDVSVKREVIVTR